MKVLVTGAAGFLGRTVVERLLARGTVDLRVTIRSARQRELLEGIAARHSAARVEYVQANLVSAEDAARAAEGVDTVYHLAANMRGAPADIFLNTVVGSKNLLEAIAPRARVVLVSSFSVYGVAELPRGALVDEHTPLERHPERRDVYTYAKLRQELLCRELAASRGFELLVLRPGVIYGPDGGALSSRVGMSVFGIFLFLGRDNILPLSYVDNCAEAIAVVGHSGTPGEVYNVHDDDLPTCRAYLAAYKKQVQPFFSVPLPYPALALLSAAVERYHRWSRGQLSAAFTPYKTASVWGGNRFDNSKLKSLGWSQPVTTGEGMRRTFAALKAAMDAGRLGSASV